MWCAFGSFSFFVKVRELAEALKADDEAKEAGAKAE